MSLVGPALDLPPAGVEAQFLIVALFLPRLVNVFERLERENGGADLAGFAVPDQLDFAFVGKEDESVFLRQRLALIDKLDEVALPALAQIIGRTTDGRG